MKSRGLYSISLLLCFFAGGVQGGIKEENFAAHGPDFGINFDEEYDTKQWKEMATVLPSAPNEATLQEFFVSAVTDHRFFIDTSTLKVDADGVVRYVLVVKTSGGAKNVTFEGMRCVSREQRIYASGLHNGGWAKSRNNEWTRIMDAYANRQHAALFLEYFCPGGSIVRNSEEAIQFFRKSGQSETRGLP